jgi:exodeoxyribonuclease VII large subunit
LAQRNYIDLLTLQAGIRECISESFPERYWVKAEIASWSPRANGHCYLSLVQTRGGKSVAESRAMIWKWHYPQLVHYFEQATGQRLQAGITVLVRVQVAFSELYGISLYIDDIDADFTLGEQALERKRAIEQLQKDGYMDMQKELVLPDLPYRLAVITSKTAAGYQDFRNHLLDNPEGYVFQLDLYEALMQGEQAPSSIREALAEAGEKDYDAILILRGGGSELDLQCFDDFDLAVAIATCPVPVVTAIGHDKDVHIADMVAHQAVKTPTALADLFLDAYAAQDDILDRLQGRIAAGLRRLVSTEELRVKGSESAIRSAIQRRISALEVLLQRSIGRISRGLAHKYADVARLKDAVLHRLQFAAQARYNAAYSALALKEARIRATDPRNILSLGYVLVTGQDNQILKTVQKVTRGDRIGVRFSDGSLTARVDEVFTAGSDLDESQTA